MKRLTLGIALVASIALLVSCSLPASVTLHNKEPFPIALFLDDKQETTIAPGGSYALSLTGRHSLVAWGIYLGASQDVFLFNWEKDIEFVSGEMIFFNI